MIKEEILKSLKSAGIETTEDKLETPPSSEMGDYAFPCFELSKVQKKNPNQIAQETADKMKIWDFPLIERIEVKGAYINFFLNWGKFSGTFLKEILKGKYGKLDIGKKKRILIEFAHPNTHKGFHIGHFRNICLGESLCRVLEFTGYKVFRVNYQGDVGPHIAKALWAYINIYGGKVPEDKKENKAEWLGELYAETEKRIGDEKVANEVAEINKKLYEGDKKISKLWKETRKWSLDYFGKIYKELGTGFDRFYFETEVGKKGVKISEEALKRGIAERSEGAIIINLEKYGLGIFVLISKDKTPLYSAKDLELAELQFKEFKFDQCIHLVSSEQNLYFKQLFKTLELIGSSVANKKYHLSYELVTLKEGKMASRLGNVVLYRELKNKVMQKVLEEMKEREMKNKEKIAEIIGIGAMKYGMLKISPEKVIFFDWLESLKLEGNTGPYLQYAHTRCNGILGKVDKWAFNFKIEKLSEEEKQLVKTLVKFKEVVEQAAKNLRPHIVCNYTYELATALDKFYEFCPVLKAENKKLKNFRLTLVKATAMILKDSLDLLGIEVPEKM